MGLGVGAVLPPVLGIPQRLYRRPDGTARARVPRAVGKAMERVPGEEGECRA